MTRLFMIALGGAAGSLLRYAIAETVRRCAGDTFPVGTLVVNVLGCLAIGVIGGLVMERMMAKDDVLFALLAIGVLGGFTTFSAFGWETFDLLHQKQFFKAGLYILLSNALGLAGVWTGYMLSVRWAIAGSP